MSWQQDVQLVNPSTKAIGDAIALLTGVENPEFLIIDLVFQLLSIANIELDPFGKIEQALTGRPKMEATYEEAKAFMSRRSPALRMLGVGASKALHAGIPLSSPEVGPIFGPYYQAALVIENALRWGSQNQSVTNVDNATLTAAMHEAGNPGQAGSATLDAMDRAWELSGDDPNKVNALRALQIWTGAGLAADLIRSFGQTYNTKYNPGPVGTPTQQPTLPPPPVIPAPPPAAPPPPPMPAPLVIGQIFINVPFEAILHGDFELTTQVQGGPFPTAHLELRIDGQEVERTPAGTHDGHTPIHPTMTLHTRQFKDGQHRLQILWIGERGLVHAQITTLVHFLNHEPQAPPPPPPKPVPPPPPAIPWADWFRVCAEVPNCEHLSDEGLAVVQSISNVAFMLNHIFLAQTNVQEDPCCQQLIAVLTRVNSAIAALGSLMPAPLNLMPLVDQLKCICDQITNVAVDIKVEKPDLDALVAELHKDNETLVGKLEQLREAFTVEAPALNERIARSRAQRKQLIEYFREQNDLDPAIVQLLDS